MLQLHDLQTELMEVLHPLLKGGILRPGGLMIVTFKFGSGYTEETWDRMAAQQAAQVRYRPLAADCVCELTRWMDAAPPFRRRSWMGCWRKARPGLCT